MKRPIALFGVLLFLAACTGAPVTGSYELSMTTDDPAEREMLTLAALRVIQRRIDSMQVPLLEQTLRQEEGRSTIDVTVDDPATIDLLTEQLARPFTLRVMVQTETEEGADATVEGYGGFRQTAITEHHVSRVESGQDDEGKGAVRIILTEEGRRISQQLMAEEEGKRIGIFVRDVLMSVLPAAETGSEDIVIRGIPDGGLAEIFADDVLVGTHVQFSPVSSPLLP